LASLLGVTCPPRTEPASMLDWKSVKEGGVDGQKGIQAGTDHQD
jgi:hypothetical protein